MTDPLILANSFYSAEIISREVLDRIKLPTLTPGEKNVVLFDAIEARIRTHPSDFCSLLTILSYEPSLRDFAKRIEDSYCECFISVCFSTCVRPSAVKPLKI